MSDETNRELSYGERAVGLSFNPSQDEHVKTIKEQCAVLIDHLDDMRKATEDGEQKRLCSVAITELQTAQMWAVKAATWGYNK
jgi:hypothetical protein